MFIPVNFYVHMLCIEKVMKLNCFIKLTKILWYKKGHWLFKWTGCLQWTLWLVCMRIHECVKFMGLSKCLKKLSPNYCQMTVSTRWQRERERERARERERERDESARIFEIKAAEEGKVNEPKCLKWPKRKQWKAHRQQEHQR